MFYAFPSARASDIYLTIFTLNTVFTWINTTALINLVQKLMRSLVELTQYSNIIFELVILKLIVTLLKCGYYSRCGI